MREPPRLANETIIAALQAHYGIAVQALTFLPLGADSASWVYRVQATGGANYFLKVRAAGGFSPPSLLIPHYLASHGLPHIIAPLPTNTQALWVSLDDFALSLYPFLDARAATDVGLSEQQWHDLGTAVGQIHRSQLPPDLAQTLRRESFIPSRRDVLDRLEAIIDKGTFADPIQRELGQFWRAHQVEIRQVIGRADALGGQLRRASLPLVLCHADLHTWNVLLDDAGQMWLVDWDETILAPKERDLMFVVGGIASGLVTPRETQWFLQGYGNAAIDRLALVYYRYAWAVQDMGAYGEDVFFRPDLGQVSRREALRGFQSLFAPGQIVAIARASNGGAP